jgi:hypothetical protein
VKDIPEASLEYTLLTKKRDKVFSADGLGLKAIGI